MKDRIEKVLRDVIEQATPKPAERAKMETLARKLERKVSSTSKRMSLKAKIRTEGSFAKDTWLSGERDMDIFMRVSRSIPREALGDVCLKVARTATKGSKQIERFAEHPYLEALVDGIRVNIVPCYATKRGEWISSTDRTPFHTDYINNHLDRPMRGEVRLLKKFMKGIGVYGAEIRIGGFSGYLCELLILHYKTFVKTIEAFSKNKSRIIMDVENHYENRERELVSLFDEPLIIVDPVDRDRNVASAVQPQKLNEFVAAAQAFLKTPQSEFFYPQKTIALDDEEIKKRLNDRGSVIVYIVFGCVQAVPDVLWGQLYKSQRSLRKLLQLNDFRVLRDVAWSDEEELNMFVFELEENHISSVRKHYGPPLDREREGEKFVAKYVHNADVVSGPYVEEGRWVVLMKRKYTDAYSLLKEKLREGGKSAGMAERISQVLKKGFKVLNNKEIDEVYKKNDAFAVFLTDFLEGRPKWLETAQRESN